MTVMVIELPPMDNMLAAVGRGIQAFAGIETAFSYLYAELMHPAPAELALAGLGAARHFETKLRIISAVGQERLTDENLVKFKAIINKTNRRGDLRNKLAHWTTGFWHKNMPVASNADMMGLEVRLYLAFKTAGNMNFQPRSSVRLCEVEAFTSSCIAITLQIFDFTTNLQAQRC